MDQNYLKKGGLFKPKFRLKKVMSYVLIMALAIASASAQNLTVSGKVTDGSGEGLPGVNVLIKGTLNGAVTDIEGNYQLSVPSGATLVFTYVGFATQEIDVNAQNTISIIMSEDYGQLDEVVVVGYGTTKKSDLTGAVTAIDSKQFNKGQINTPQGLLTGRIAGVNVTSSDGQPGSGAQIRIRGGSSLSASNDPLIVVDGVPLTTDEIGGIRNPLSTINPQDIETITVLKDASATAIYGARASNGVILVTTKRGQVGAGISVNYSAQFSLSTLPEIADNLTPEEFASLVNESSGNGDISPVAATLLGSTQTNWQNEVYQQAQGTNHNISASGAFKGVPFRVSTGYLFQEGILRTSSFERTSISLGLDPSFLNDDLRVSINLKGSQTNNGFTNDGVIGSAATFDPTQPVFDSESPFGGYYFYRQSLIPTDPGFLIPDNNAPKNPVGLLEQTNNDSRVNRFIGNINFNYKLPIEGLSANLNLATDRTTTDGLEVVDSLAQSERRLFAGNVIYGKINKYDNQYQNDLFEFYLNYAKELPGLDSRFEVIGGYSYQYFFRETGSYETDIIRSVTTKPINPDPSENKLISFYGRLKYDFKEKYLLTVTVRRDGSSRFLGDNQWGIFPSAALAWRIKDESFLTNVDIVSDLKIRAGYGVTAQENIGESYPALARISIGEDDARYQLGRDGNGNPIFINVARFEAFDPNLKWEETTTINVGVDFGFWNGRINGSFDWYKRETTDLLNTIDIPAGTNFSNRILTNVGSLENNGLEFALNGIVVDNADWRVDLGFNLTRNTNEITRLTNSNDPDFLGNETGGISGGTGNVAQINSVGFNRSTFWLLQQVYDANGNPIEGVYVDQDGDGQYTNADRVRSKNPDPTMFMGFSSFVSYKKVSLTMNGRYQTGNYVYHNIASANGNINGLYTNNTLRNIHSSVLDTRFVGTGFLNNLLSNYYLEDASFFRMDNITVGYSLEKFLNDRFSANVSFTVQNAFVITNYSGLDPEVADGIDDNIYPRPRVFTLGLNVNFK
ncbi:MAG: TonB-dependent receptor [Ekhidna sp.]